MFIQYLCSLNQTIKKATATSIFFLVVFWACSQRIDYKIKAGGVKLGDFKIEKHVYNDSTVYLLKSSVTLNFLITKHRILYSSISTYYKGILRESWVRAVENGSLDKSTRTQRTKTGYHVTQYEDEEEKQYDIPHVGIQYSTSRLFFEMPPLQDSSYAELYGNFGDFSTDQTNVIKITNQVTGSETVYFYENNQPIKRKIEYPIVDFLMFMISSKPFQRAKKEVYGEFFTF